MDIPKRIAASWLQSGLLQLFGVNANGEATGGGLLGVLKGGKFSIGGGGSGFMPTGNVGIWDILKGLPSFGGGIGGGIGGIFKAIFSGLPGLASGTLSANGGLTWVGEQGPELVNLPRGGQVFPADVSAALMNGGGNGGVVKVEVDKSALFDVHVRKIAGPMAEQAARVGVQGGAGLAQYQAAEAANRRIEE